MILISALTVIMFLGGWHAPFEIAPFTWIPGIFWFFGKVGGSGVFVSLVSRDIPTVPL